jgi:uncharacterized protein
MCFQVVKQGLVQFSHSTNQIKMKKIFSILSFFVIVIGFAQKTTLKKDSLTTKIIEIKILSRVQKDKILLRWAVTDAIAWKKLNKYGYLLERYTIARDNKTLTTPEKVVLVAEAKPDALENWEKEVKSNENAAIIAQAIYGKSFVTGGNDKIQAIINLSEETEQRFTFALFTADKDFEIAKKAGLGYEDKTALKNEKYVYRVSSNVPETELTIKYGGVFVVPKEYEELPKPMDFTAHFTDKGAMLSWNFKILSHAYGSYYVERSLDKINFERITKKPFTSMNQENENNSRIFYADTITNNKSYSYRVQGISTFGELGPYSQIITGKGKSILKFVPHLTVKDCKEDNSVTLTWEFPEEGDNDITGFELNRADKDEDKYVAVVKNIAPKDRTVIYKKLEPTNYFTITAIGKNGANTTSSAMLVQPIDSIPPAKPIGLKAVIDSLGVVKITWDANKEKDLMGYRIYRGNNPTEEFSQLTVSPSQPNSYTDKVVVKSLNSKVFYKVIAVDNRYNMSPYSEMLIVKKPDVIAPTSPVFTHFEAKDGTVFLEWVNSQSEDVASQLLYRKENDQKDWALILEDKNKLEKYQDKNLKPDTTYRYAIFAKDDSKLVSNPGPEVAIFVPKSTNVPTIKGFFAQANPATNTIDLSWNYTVTDLESFELYKAIGDQPLQLMQVVTPQTKRLADPTITVNTNYKYGIRALFTDGRMSPMAFFSLKY